MNTRLLTVLILTFTTQLLVAQNLKRANNLFERRSYLNAAELYLKEEPKTQEIYEKLGDCYYFNSKMNQAVLFYELLFDNYEQTTKLTYLFRYSQSLKGVKKYSKADKWNKKYYEKKQLDPVTITGTLSFFDSLNTQNKRPYIIQELSSNSIHSDFGTSYYKDSIVFSSSRNSGKLYEWNNQPYLDLFFAEKTKSGDLVNVKPFSDEINTKLHESNAVFTKDGKTMYFTRNNSKNRGKVKYANKIAHLKIYKAMLVDGTWTNITELPFNSKDYSVEHPALSPDESQLYFASDMPGSIGSFDLFVVDIFPNGTYGRPKNLGSKINTDQREQFPFISSTNTLYFSSNGHFGLGGFDIFKSQITKNTFSTPINLNTEINSNLDDFAFIIDEENEIGYFSSNRLGGLGNDDIYGFKQLILPKLTGTVINKNSKEPLTGTKIMLFDQNNTPITTTIVDENGAYSIEVEPNKTYTIKVLKDLYVPFEMEFTTTDKAVILQNIELALIQITATKFEFDPEIIYFDLNSSYLRKEGKEELTKIAKFLQDNPQLIISCKAHTDSRASNRYNMWLSERRAKRSADYLIHKGVPSIRVSIQYFGETQLVNKCTNGVKCEESKHQMNRRAQLIFYKIIL